MKNSKIIVFFILALSLCMGVNKTHAQATLVHQYTFNDAWDVTGAVQDTAGNPNGSVNGSVIGNVTKVTTATFGGTNMTCSAANFNEGLINLSGLDLITADNGQTTVTFWMRWEDENNQMPFSWYRHDLWLRDGGFGFNSWVGNVYGITDDDLAKKWVHVTAIFKNKKMEDNKLYINGIDQSLSLQRGNFSNTNAFVKTSMAIGGNDEFFPNYHFNGLIGNFRMYKGALTETEAANDMANINDACQPIIIAPSVEYRFDNQHTFSTNDIVDSSGSNNHGTAFVATTTEGLLCDAIDFSNTGTSDYIVANHNALNGVSDFTAMAWVKTTQTHDATLFSAGSADSGVGTNEATFYIDDGNRFWPTITASPFNTSTRLGSTDVINNGQWHQVVWTRTASTKQSCFFFDGAPQGCVTHNDLVDVDPLVVINGGFIIGQEQDSLGAGFDSSQAFDGIMDEFMIFNSVLSNASIDEINTNIRAGNNWDATPRVCPIVMPVLDMQFDETSWVGSSSILDSSGNNYHGTPFGTASPIDGELSCNAADLTQAGTSDYISVNYNAINNLEDFTVIFWGKRSHSSHLMTALSGAGGDSAHEFQFYYRNNNRVRVRIHGDGIQQADSFDGNWHQYAWTRNKSTKESCIYKDGSLLRCGFTVDGNPLNISPNGFVIGQDQGNVGGGFASNQAWEGLIDELLVFPSILPQNRIEEIRQNILDEKDWQGNDKVCPIAIDHFRFMLPAAGVTCLDSAIELKACQNASCSANSSVNASVTLSPSGLWSGADVTGNNVSFNAGSTSLFLSQTNPLLTPISASSLSPTPSSATPVQCYNSGVMVDCELAFSQAGFLFEATPLSGSSSTNIASQISNKPSSVDYNGQTITIRAVEENTITGACQAIFPVGNQNINVSRNCVSGTCSNINIETQASASSFSVGAGTTSIPFAFDATGKAQLELTYPNAGLLSLTAQKSAILATGALESISGTSNNFVVKPFGFYVTIDEPNAHATTASGTVFKKAGEDFAVNAIAIGWQPDLSVSEDVNHDGNIDVGKNADDNPTVQFFAGEQVKLTHELQLPSGGNAGSFNDPEAPLNDSTAKFTNARWSEVGIISLKAQLKDNDYLGAGDVIGVISNVGRFTPHHFSVSDITVGEFVGSALCFNQTFIGELTAGGDGALNYRVTQPSMKITAKNLAGGPTGTTLNYHGDFKRFDETNITFDLPTQDSVNSLALTSVINTGSVSGSHGVFTYTASADDHFVYIRNTASKMSPFAANVNYTASILADDDSVGLDTGVTLPTLSATSSTSPQHLMRYGRVQLNNTFGPESEPLAMQIEHQFFDGTKFVVNPHIGAACVTPIFPNTDFTLLPATLGDLNQGALPSSSAWNAGNAGLLIPSPNTVQGVVEFSLDVPTWLMFDWDNAAATPDSKPKANVTFGRYRGNDRIINWRERR